MNKVKILVGSALLMFAGSAAAMYADVVVSYTPGDDVEAPFNDPNQALGAPDFTQISNGEFASLGDGGELVLQFTEVALYAGRSEAFDLKIYEIGPVVEDYNVSISTDGTDSSWIDVGTVSGQPADIDIDPFVLDLPDATAYTFVRLADVNPPSESGLPYGEADIDAIEALTTAPVPLPPAVLLFASAVLFGVRKRASVK